ncbi:MAG TPA: hypothetical protein PKC20_15390 [Burkholderiaceae bacterium]|nr:hypothetical protein [Burkholderiaceae bacterium]
MGEHREHQRRRHQAEIQRTEREPLDRAGSPVLWAFLIASAAIMVVGVVNLFGIEPAAAQAAAALVD